MEPEESLACPVCGGELQPRIICPYCGADITLKSLEGLESSYKCPVCGKEAQTKFVCNECGSEFKYDLITAKMGAVESIKKEEKKPVTQKSTSKAENLVELRGGLTNGISTQKKRRRGLTNGLTNGLAAEKKNGGGLTNGLKGGMVNGTGVTNGTKPAKKSKTHKKSSKMPAIAATVLVLILIFGAFYISIMPQKGEIKIDGNFSDWKDLKIRDEFKAPMHSLDMKKYSSKLSDGRLSIYLESRDNLFVSRDRIYAFVDSDNKPSTGYRINGIGADYLCKVYGEGGKITAHGAYAYDTDADGYAWAWGGSLPLSAAYNGNKLEMAFYPDHINKNYRICFYTSDSHGNYEVSSVNIGEGASVYFEARPWSQTNDIYTADGNSIHLMDIGIFVTGGDATIQAITLTAENVGNVRLIDSSGNTVATMENNRLTLNRAISDGGTVNYELWGTVSGATGSLISLDINPQVLVSPASAILKTNIEPFKAYLGQPTGIQIDGAFGDWKNVQSDPNDGLPDHIDIREYSSLTDSGNLYFYLRVQDKMMAGVLVPEKYAKGVPNPPVTSIPKTETGEDILRVHIDTENGEYIIEILGKEGKIVSESISGPGIGGGSVQVAKDSTRIEGGIPLQSIGNPSTIKISFEMSDWEGNSDLTDSMVPLDQSASPTRYRGSDATPVPEFSEMLIPILFTIGMAVLIARRRKT